MPSRDPEALLRRMEWTVIRRLDGLLYGDYRTLFRGLGLDLADLREYQLHDDVRHIDWNVTARLQTPYVREYNEDREVTAWFLLDLSPSVDFGSLHVKKRAVLTDFVSVLARLLTRNGNRVGAMFYGSTLERTLVPRPGRRQVLHLMTHLMSTAESTPSGVTELGAFLRAAAQVIRRRSLVFVVSDFISEPGWENPLVHLAQRNEVLAVRLFDPLEVEMPDLGLVVMQDAETGEQLFVDTHDRAFRKRFAEAAAQRETALRRSISRAGVDTLELSTGDDLVDAVLRFAELRRHRRRFAAAGGLPAHLTTRPDGTRPPPVGRRSGAK
jgi:uncharacterized protein (DUF58 family)